MARHRLVLSLGLLLVALAAPPARAQDSDRLRFYGSLRLGAAVPLDSRPTSNTEISGLQQLTGFSFGVNLNRHVGFEIAGDSWEFDLHVPGAGKLGELGTFSAVPLFRLRYPLLGDRLTPYVLAGVGIGWSEFNDRKTTGVGTRIRTGDVGVVGSLGAGIEYFLADNVAVGLETKVMLAGERELEVVGRREDADLSVVTTTASLRLLWPEGPQASRSSLVGRKPGGRFSLGFRFGGVAMVDDRAASGIEIEKENAAIGPFSQVFGVNLGWTINRYLALEVSAEGYEPTLSLRGIGRVEEYAQYNVIPQARLTYPVLDDLLVPYLVAGVGASYGELNDGKRPLAESLRVNNTYRLAPVGALGAGIDYFVASNLSVGVESRYIISRSHTITVNGRDVDLDLDAVVVSLGVRIFFGEPPGR